MSTMPIYMDHNATTPLDPTVFSAMEPFFKEQFGNPSSASHAYGWQAQTAVKVAREQVAALVGCEPNQVVWTSGASESNNLAILGVVRAFSGKRPHIITQTTEHKAVLEVCEAAEEWGAEVTVLPVDAEGLVSLKDIKDAIRPNTVMVSIMAANNEVGTLQPISEIAALCQERELIFHTDAAQACGKCTLAFGTTSIDLMSISGHKIYGPKGIGALIVRPKNREFALRPILFGGEQERKMRPGTLNVPGVVGLGKACALVRENMDSENKRLHGFQQAIFNAILERFPQVKVNGSRQHRLCNNISLSLPDFAPDDLILDMSGVAYSSGSACNSSNPQPSHVLKAMGVSDSMARATLRLGLGRFTTAAEVQIVTDKLLKMLEKKYARGGAAGSLPL